MTTALESLHLHINLHLDEGPITRSMNNLHSTMSCVLSEELAPTPLKAVQVMVAKVLSLITLVTLRVLVTLSSDMETFVKLVMTKVTPSSLKSTPSENQEMVGAGTPVAVHISAPEAPSDKVTVGFWEATMAASGATGRDSANDTKWMITDKSYACSNYFTHSHSLIMKTTKSTLPFPAGLLAVTV